MVNLRRLNDRVRGLNDAIARYPLTAIFLLAAVVVNAIDISKSTDNSKLLITFVVGAFLGAAFQAAFERFFNKPSGRLILMGVAAILTAGYYLIIMQAPKFNLEIGIRTAIALFALLIAFIWLPVIKSRISFNDSFMAAFKSLFNSLLYSAVIFGGVAIIIAAIDQLLFNVNDKAYAHGANIVFILFAPMYFLSLIPVYPGAADTDLEQGNIDTRGEKIDRAVHCPKFLEILISYILIPLVSVFTIILLIYIIRNIGGKFWTDNLLEPMIISYSITIILLYILASELQNKFALFFRWLFPKLLIPIVLFQVISSVISLGETGITHTRYFVIIYGIFAIASGVVLSIVPVKKNGIIAAMLIGFALISIVPPVDAFTVSRISQTDILKKVLIKNNMLENNQIKPNSSIADEDKKTIVKTVEYLNMLGYIDKIQWMPVDFKIYEDFTRTFGFEQYGMLDRNNYVNIMLDQRLPINIEGYDSFVSFYINIPGTDSTDIISDIEKSGKKYTLTKFTTKDDCIIYLTNEDNQELIKFSAREMFDKFRDYGLDKEMITTEEASFTKEKELARITLIVRNLNMDNTPGQSYNAADLYALIEIK